MSPTTDQVLARRRVLLITFLIGWGAWYGFFVAQQAGLYGFLPAGTGIVLTVVGIAGWFVFAVAMVKILNSRKRYKDNPEARAALDDELTRDQNRRATHFGFIAILLTQVGLVVLGDTLGMTAEIGAHISIFIGVATIMGAFLWFDLTE